MNPLSEMPHLFANGKFKIKYKDHLGETQIGVLDGLHLELMNGDCKLIARSIESMSEKELWQAHLAGELDREIDQYVVDEWREVLTQWANLDDLDFSIARYLLDIGVLPFDQSHFGDTVIDTRTLTNA